MHTGGKRLQHESTPPVHNAGRNDCILPDFSSTVTHGSSLSFCLVRVNRSDIALCLRLCSLQQLLIFNQHTSSWEKTEVHGAGAMYSATTYVSVFFGG